PPRWPRRPHRMPTRASPPTPSRFMAESDLPGNTRCTCTSNAPSLRSSPSAIRVSIAKSSHRKLDCEPIRSAIAMVDKSIIGKTGKPFTMPIEWGKVREFARAIRDPNPVYFDPELAKKECGGVPIPVTFLQTSAFWQTAESTPPIDMFDMRRILHGEQEFEFFKPILVGDTLTGLARVSDIYEKEGGRGGKMTFLAVEAIYTNQRNERVARARFVLL